jgi:Uma2 family endonuclease
MATGREATIEDLSRIKQKAEIVGGEIVLMSPTGGLPGYAGGVIFASMHAYAQRTRLGYALPDNVGFLVRLATRRSFSPDAAFTDRPLTGTFIDGAPLFAVEVRSEEDYGPAAERAMAAKRADYFAAGTVVVWDVDVLKERTVFVYRATAPLNPTVYHRGEMAEAEPALPGWTMAVDDLCPPPLPSR